MLENTSTLGSQSSIEERNLASFPCAGATVGEWNAQALVENGVYKMLVDAGQVTITTSAGAYHEASVSQVSVKAGEAMEVNIPMSPSGIIGDLDGLSFRGHDAIPAGFRSMSPSSM